MLEVSSANPQQRLLVFLHSQPISPPGLWHSPALLRTHCSSNDPTLLMALWVLSAHPKHKCKTKREEITLNHLWPLSSASRAGRCWLSAASAQPNPNNSESNNRHPHHSRVTFQRNFGLKELKCYEAFVEQRLNALNIDTGTSVLLCPCALTLEHKLFAATIWERGASLTPNCWVEKSEGCQLSDRDRRTCSLWFALLWDRRNCRRGCRHCLSR